MNGLLSVLTFTLPLFWTFMTSSLEASTGTRVEILPVKWEIVEEGKISIHYRLPCGAKERGVFLRNSSLEVVRIGIAIDRPHQRCVGISAVKSVVMPHIKINSETQLESFNPSLESLRYDFFPAHRNRRVQDSEKPDGYERGIELSYRSQCGQFMGVIASLAIDSMPLLGAIESSTDFDPGCEEPGESIRAVTGVEIASLERSPSDGQIKPYKIAIAPIQAGSLRLGGKGSKVLSFKYLRRCFESPIGIVSRKKGEHMEFAMVVAKYEKDICPQKGARRLWSRYNTRIFAKADLENLRPITHQAKDGFEFVIDEPNQVVVTKDNKVNVTTVSKCMPILGTLVAEKFNHRFLGLVRYYGPSHSECHKGINKVEIIKDIPSRLAKLGFAGPLKLAN